MPYENLEKQQHIKGTPVLRKKKVFFAKREKTYSVKLNLMDSFNLSSFKLALIKKQKEKIG
jgi:hypothetical protein